MILQMFGSKFRPWRVNTQSGGKRDFVVPWPDKAPMPKEVEKYEECDWKWQGDEVVMPLIDFLRKTNADGLISHWLVTKHKQHVEDMAFALHISSGRQQMSRRKFLDSVSPLAHRDNTNIWDHFSQNLGI